MRAPGPAALGAYSDYSQQVLGDFKLVPGRHKILNRLELGRVEFDNLATLRADHVVMVLVLVLVLVVGAAISETDFASQTGISQKLQGAIYSSLTDIGIFAANKAVEIFAGQMLFGTQKDLENEVALNRALESLLLDVSQKYFLFFAHVQAINGFGLPLTGNSVFGCPE